MNLFGLICLTILCNWSITIHGQNSYSFFIAGHTSSYFGVNPEFVDHFEYLNNHPDMELGMILGDMVKANPTPQQWDSVDLDLDSLNMPFYFAAGNHDMEDRPLYESRYGETYYHFVHKNDLFIVLDPNLDHWNISGEQYLYVKELVETQSPQVDNIYVFFHQFLFRESSNKYSHIDPNSFTGYTGVHNFWTHIEPIFHFLPNQVVFACGDFGAGPWSDNFMYDTYDNITLLGTGMGEGNGDNYFIVNVAEDKSLNVEIRCLDTNQIDCFGELSQYIISTPVNPETMVFPNPTTSEIIVKFNDANNNHVRIWGMKGELLLNRKYNNRTGVKLFLDDWSSGIYLLQITDQHGTSTNHKVYKQ